MCLLGSNRKGGGTGGLWDRFMGGRGGATGLLGVGGRGGGVISLKRMEVTLCSPNKSPQKTKKEADPQPHRAKRVIRGTCQQKPMITILTGKCGHKCWARGLLSKGKEGGSYSLVRKVGDGKGGDV